MTTCHQDALSRLSCVQAVCLPAGGLSWPLMIRVCCSNRTEALLQAFVRNLQRERQSDGPFAPVRVLSLIHI